MTTQDNDQEQVQFDPTPVGESGSKQPAGMIVKVLLGFVAVLGVGALLYFFFFNGAGGTKQLLVGFPNKDGEYDVYLYDYGQEEKEGVLIAEELVDNFAAIHAYASGRYVKTVELAGFLDGAKSLPLIYADKDDTLLEMYQVGKDERLDIADTEDAFGVYVNLDKKLMFIFEYADGGARCFVAQLGEEADRLGKGSGCYFSEDGSTLFIDEHDDGEYQITAVDTTSGEEMDVLKTENPASFVTFSPTGQSTAYVEEDDGEYVIYLLETKTGDEIFESDDYQMIYDVGFINGEIGYFIAENDDEELVLHIFGENEEVVAEAVFLGAVSAGDGNHLFYFTGEDEADSTAFSYSVKSGESVEIFEGEYISISNYTYGNRAVFADMTEEEDAVTFYSSEFDGSDVKELWAFDYDEYSMGGVYYQEGMSYAYVQVYSFDDEAYSLYYLPLDEEDGGFFLLEGWAEIYILNADRQGEILLFAAAEDVGDDVYLYSIPIEDGADEVELDDDVENVMNAVFSPNGKDVLYTGITGSDLDDMSVFQVPVDGEDKPEEIYEEARLLDIGWSLFNAYQSLLDYDSGYEAASSQTDVDSGLGTAAPVSAYKMVNGASIGDPNAPVHIIEFSDFRCSHCRNFAQEAEEEFFEEYVYTGKVYFTYRSAGEWVSVESARMAEAAYCAEDQGMFWDYHEILFYISEFSDEYLISISVALGMDEAAFSSCLLDDKYADRVAKDRDDAISFGIQGTPTFFVNGVNTNSGSNYEVLKEFIESALP